MIILSTHKTGDRQSAHDDRHVRWSLVLRTETIASCVRDIRTDPSAEVLPVATGKRRTGKVVGGHEPEAI